MIRVKRGDVDKGIAAMQSWLAQDARPTVRTARDETKQLKRRIEELMELGLSLGEALDVIDANP